MSPIADAGFAGDRTYATAMLGLYVRSISFEMYTRPAAIPAPRGADRVRVLNDWTTFAEARMKRYRWFILIAAVLITVCEVLVFASEAGHAPQEQADEAALTDVDSGRHVPGG
jgi:hypothetical protein